MKESADRWKIDGDCSKCRRQPYCKRACKLNRKVVADMMTRAIYAKTGLGAIMEHLGRSE